MQHTAMINSKVPVHMLRRCVHMMFKVCIRYVRCRPARTRGYPGRYSPVQLADAYTNSVNSLVDALQPTMREY